MCRRIYVMYAGAIVEEGTADDIFYRPAHPYTQGLLASLPDPAQKDKALTGIPGQRRTSSTCPRAAVSIRAAPRP